MPPTLARDAETILADVLTQLAASQPGYLARRGTHWQGIPSHAAIPRDGALVVPDRTRKPADQAESWNGVGAWPGVTLPATMPCAVQVDVYDGPAGKGYEVSVDLIENGVRWVKTSQVGPETWRGHDWRRVESGPGG